MAQVTVRDFLADVERDCPGTVVVVDMEAGVEHLSRAGGTLRNADLLLVVVQGTGKALLTAARTTVLARQLGIAEVAYVANRVRAGDQPRLEAFATEQGGVLIAALPEDAAIGGADRVGLSLVDHAPTAPSVAAIADLADALSRRIAPPGQDGRASG